MGAVLPPELSVLHANGNSAVDLDAPCENGEMLVEGNGVCGSDNIGIVEVQETNGINADAEIFVDKVPDINGVEVSTDELTRIELPVVEEVFGGKTPEDASTIWPESILSVPTEPKPVGVSVRKVFSYYLVKIPRPVDNKNKSEILKAELQLKERTEKRDLFNAAFQIKKASREEVLERLKIAREKERICREAFREKFQEIKPLQEKCNKLKAAARPTKSDLCTSEKELDHKIAMLEHRIQHESIPLKEEKLLLKEIQQLKATRQQVCANEAMQVELEETKTERDNIQDLLKPLYAELEVLKKELKLASDMVVPVDEEYKSLYQAANELRGQREKANALRQGFFEARQVLYKQEHERNDEFYQNRRDIQTAKHLAANRNKEELEKFCTDQVEEFFALWNSSLEYRVEYLKNNERSTLRRLETFDGRSLGPDEEPPSLSNEVENHSSMAHEATAGAPQHTTKENGTVKKGTANVNALVTASELKEPQTSVSKPVEMVSLSRAEEKEPEVDPEAEKRKEVEAAEAKEKRKQEEKAKAREAEERKKKLAERNQAKALYKAQKEAEKREKEKEKRARKKAAAVTPVDEMSEATLIENAAQDVQMEETVAISLLKKEVKTSSNLRRRPVAPKVKILKPAGGKKSNWWLSNWHILAGVSALIALACFAGVMLLIRS